MTRQDLASALDVSMVTVQKWLSDGGMKDSSAQALASHVLCDWLWLKYGICRVPEEIERSLGSALSDALVVTFRRDKWYVEQMGCQLRRMFKRPSDDDVLELDTEALCLPCYWDGWSDWAARTFSVPVLSDAPYFDCSDALIDINGQVVSDRCMTKLVTVWTDSQGMTKGVITKI